RGILDIAVNGHMRKQRVILEHESDRSPLGRNEDPAPRIVPGLFAHPDAAESSDRIVACSALRLPALEAVEQEYAAVADAYEYPRVHVSIPEIEALHS